MVEYNGATTMDYGAYTPFSYREGEYLKAMPEHNQLTAGEYTINRMNVVASTVVTGSGTVRFTHFTATKDETISQVRVISGSTAAGPTPTKVRFGVYSIANNGDFTLVASTPNDTTLLATASTAYTKALSEPFNKIKGQRYAFGVFVETAFALPTMSGFIANTLVTTSEPKLSTLISGQTDLPSTISSGILGLSSQLTYAELLP